MKRILIITTCKKLVISFSICLILCLSAVLLIFTMNFYKQLEVFNDGEGNIIQELEKENDKLKNIFSSIIPAEQKIIVEDEYRNIYINSGIAPPPPLNTTNISKVISQGNGVKFKILSDDPNYLRPLYDPDWKDFYFRGWLYLPNKNIDARHRIFAFSLGASSNFDILGSLGYKSKVRPSEPLDNHHNINFIIYGFNVKNVKVFENQVVLVGEPKQAGAQIVSIVQNDLLPAGVDTKDFIFQLATGKGYEVDFLYQNIIRYEYLMKQIEEHTVHPAFTDESENKTLEMLLKENAALKKELSYFIPIEDKIIPQQICDSMSGNQDEIDIALAIKQGSKVSFDFNYKDSVYKRPLYDPGWKTNYKRKWCYMPNQIQSNMHRLHVIPQDINAQYDFFGVLGFHEKYQPIKPKHHGFVVYNFDVSDVLIYKNQLLITGIPKRSGAEIISISSAYFNEKENYLIKLTTPDNCQIDCEILAQ